MGKRRRNTQASADDSSFAALHALLAPLRGAGPRAHPRLVVGLTAVTRALQQPPGPSSSLLCLLVCQARRTGRSCRARAHMLERRTRIRARWWPTSRRWRVRRGRCPPPPAFPLTPCRAAARAVPLLALRAKGGALRALACPE
jgi:hypothetical protein